MHAVALKGHTGDRDDLRSDNPPATALKQGAAELAGFGAQAGHTLCNGIGFDSPQQSPAVTLTRRTTAAIQQSQTVRRMTNGKGILTTDPSGALLQGAIQHTRQPGKCCP